MGRPLGRAPKRMTSTPKWEELPMAILCPEWNIDQAPAGLVSYPFGALGVLINPHLDFVFFGGALFGDSFDSQGRAELGVEPVPGQNAGAARGGGDSLAEHMRSGSRSKLVSPGVFHLFSVLHFVFSKFGGLCNLFPSSLLRFLVSSITWSPENWRSVPFPRRRWACPPPRPASRTRGRSPKNMCSPQNPAPLVGIFLGKNHEFFCVRAALLRQFT